MFFATHFATDLPVVRLIEGDALYLPIAFVCHLAALHVQTAECVMLRLLVRLGSKGEYVYVHGGSEQRPAHRRYKDEEKNANCEDPVGRWITRARQAQSVGRYERGS